MDDIAHPHRSVALLWWGLLMGPALAVGGTSPWLVPPFAAAALVCVALDWRRRTELRVPTIALMGSVVAVWTLVQALPLPGARELLSGQLHTWMQLASEGIESPLWPSLSAAPADTALEAVRGAALVAVALLAAQRSWRWTATVVAATGTVVAAVGLLQYGLSVDRIYGVYQARHVDLSSSSALLATFVSPNHQSALLLLGLASTVGLWVDRTVAPDSLAGFRDRLDQRVVLAVVLAAQLTALVLSQSRGALIVAAVMAPVALLVAWWPTAPAEVGPWRGGLGTRWLSRATGLMLVTGLVVGVGTLGAWHELESLWAGFTGQAAIDPSTAARGRVTMAAAELSSLAPWAGIGRGAYGDVFPAFDFDPNHVWYSHIECAPVTLVVELGVVGWAVALVLPAWWLSAMRGAGRCPDGRARAVVLLGIGAVALQSLADFSLEFLGVAAPMAALAGALSPARTIRRGPRATSRRWAVPALALAVASTWLVPHTWIARGDPAVSRMHPLAAAPHRALAREHLKQGRFDAAERSARAAVRLQPGYVDGWLLLAAAAAGRGDEAAMSGGLTEALGRIHEPPDDALLDYVVAVVPQPGRLAALSPRRPVARSLLVRGLLEHHPRHAGAMAAVWAAREPNDPSAVQMQVEASLRLGRPALALHHARLWRQMEPRSVHAHLAVARALQIAPRARPLELAAALERALADAEIRDLGQRGLVEEQLLRALLQLPGHDARTRARQLAAVLRTRPGGAAVRKRWRELVAPL